jgi:hypothetical protein
MTIASRTATKLVGAAVPLAVMLSPALMPTVVLWSVSQHWHANLGHAPTTIVAVSAEQLPDGLSVERGMPWGIVALVGPDLSEEVDGQ